MSSEDSTCGIRCLRGILLALNILFVIIGLTLIGIGTYIHVDNNFASILSKLTTDGSLGAKTMGFLAFILIGGGVFTLLIALLGCMGVLWKNRCFLHMYGIILMLLMILELVGFILALVYKGKLKEYFEVPLSQVLEKALKNYNSTGSQDILKGFHELENAMKCCGVYNISDYAPYQIPPEKLSASCLSVKNKNKGCAQAIIEWFNKNLPIIGGTLGGVLLVELFGLLSACALSSFIKNLSNGYSINNNPKMFNFGRK